jgi:putative oxidoreductase
MNNTCVACTPRVLGTLRIVTGYLLLWHGLAKLFHVPHLAVFDNVGVFSLLGIAGIIELVVGALLILGLFVRPVAFIGSGFGAAAYFIGHVAVKGSFFVPVANGGETPILLCFIMLYLAFAGPGSWSVDGLRKKGAA